MPFVWNVHPYEFLYQAREAYTQAVVKATRGSAEAIAKEATVWMKENAPWTDRPDRPADVENDIPAFRGGAARRGLRAYVVKNKDEEIANEVGRTQAKRADVKGLANINQVRKSVGQMRMNKLPKNMSASTAFEKKLRSTRTALVDFRFTHNQKLRYPIYLEIANGGRYSIIAPALAYWTPIIMARIKSLANLVQYRSRQLPGQGLVYNEDMFQGQPLIEEEWSEARKRRRAQRRPYYKTGKRTLGLKKSYQFTDEEAEKRINEAERLTGKNIPTWNKSEYQR